MIRRLKWWILSAFLLVLVGFGGLVWFVLQAGPTDLIPPSETPAELNIPRTFDDAAMASIELPLVRPDASPVHLSSSYYYRIWIGPIYKSYPIYARPRAARLPRLVEAAGTRARIRSGESQDAGRLDQGG